MSKVNHTPGPWMNPSNSNEVMTMPSGVIKICRVFPVYENNNGEANAKLIAAAPELLRSCIQLLQCRLDHLEECGGDPDAWHEVKLAKEAIKKATT